jgi:FKBP-type peptidyl-prolyl cis-trans isomerase
MYRTLSALGLIASLSLSLFAADAEPKADPAPGMSPELKSKASYVIGQQMGDACKRFDLDMSQVVLAIQDTMSGKEPLVSPADAQKVMADFQAFQASKEKDTRSKQSEEGKKRKDTNPAYLEENAKKKGVTTTKSGLQYEVLATGKGATPAMGDTVVCSYKGQLIDGTVFDESAKHGGSATFVVGQVIQGWNEALQMMKEGDKWKLTIPSEIAYGEQAPPTIGPNQILIFEVELMKVVPKGESLP